MITYPISSNLRKKRSLQCYWQCYFSETATGGVLLEKGALGNFAKFTGKHFWSFSCLLLKISCLFHSNRKMRWKKENTMMELKYLLFCSGTDLFDVKDFKRNLTDVIWSEFVVAIFMVRGISLGKSFWVVNTWRAPVRTRLKGSAVNFAHTFLTDYYTKPCPRFS